MADFCSVHQCLSNYRDKDRRFFPFPNTGATCYKWVRLTGRSDLLNQNHLTVHKSYKICDMHFPKNKIVGNQIKKTAIPNLFLPAEDINGGNIKTRYKPSMSKREFKLFFDRMTNKQIKKRKIIETTMKTNNPDDKGESVFKLSVKAPENFKDETDCNTLLLEEKQEVFLQDVTSVHVSTCEDEVSYENQEDPLEDTKNTDNEENTTINLKYNEQYIKFVQGDVDDTLKYNEQHTKFVQGDVDDTVRACELNLFEKIHSLKTRVLLYRRNCKSFRKYLFFALNLFISSPLAYKIMKNTLSLPEKKTLRNFNVTISSKLSAEVLQCLKSKFQNYKDQEKICVINAEIIPLKQSVYYRASGDKIIGFHDINDVTTSAPAISVLLLMVKGVSSNWKQVLGYCYLSTSPYSLQLREWITNVISQIQGIGLEVKAFTTKQHNVFSNLMSYMQVSFNTPFFIVNNEAIYCINDVPELMVSVRDEFRCHRSITFFDTETRTDVSASWTAVKDLYMIDHKRSTRFAPKLNMKHLFPKNADKKKAIFAIQVFSRTVASAFNFYVEYKLLDKNCIGTAQFIELMNDIFDLCNSSKDNDKIPTKCENVETKLQIDRLLNYLGMLSTCKTIVGFSQNDNIAKLTSLSSSMSSINALRCSLRGIVSLIKELNSKYYYKYVYTRHLNHEHIEHFVESLYKNVKEEKELTVKHFETAFRKQFLLDLMYNSKCKEKVDDLDQLIKNFENLTVELNYNNSPNSGVQHISSRLLEKSNEGSFSNMWLSLLEDCYEAHQCRDADFDISENLEVFRNFIKEMDVALNRRLDSMVSSRQLSDIGKKLYESLSELSFSGGCVCFPTEYLKKLYVRYKINHLIKENNEHFEKDPSHCFGYTVIC